MTRLLGSKLCAFYLACAIVVCGNVTGLSKSAPWEGFIKQGKQQLQSGEYTDAHRSFEEALKSSRFFRNGDARFGTMYDCLGDLYLAEQDYALAGEYYQRAVPIVQKQYGADSLEVADALYGLSTAYQQGGNPMMAEIYLKRVAEIWSQKYGADSPKLLNVLPSLAVYATLSSDYDLAQRTYKRIADIQEKNGGATNPNLGSSLNSLAASVASSGNYKEAEKIAQRAVTVLEAQRENSVAYDNAVSNLEVIKAQVAAKEAGRKSMEAPPVDSATQAGQTSSPKATASTTSSVEPKSEADKKPASGVSTHQVVKAPNAPADTTAPSDFRPWELKNQEKETISNDKKSERSTNWGKIRYLAGGRLISQEEFRAMTLANEAYQLIKEEKYRMAVDILRKAIATCSTLASAHTNLGLALSRLGEIEEAIEQLKEAIAIDPARSAPWLNLASCFQINGQLKESVATYKEYLTRFPQDPFAVKAKELLAHLEEEVAKQVAVEKILAMTKDSGTTDYLLYATNEKLVRWGVDTNPIKVYIGSGAGVQGYKPEYAGFCKDSFKQWSNAAGGKIGFEFVNKPQDAAIECVWTNDVSKVSFPSEGGETRVSSTAKGIEHATITVLTSDPSPDSPLSQNQVRAICLHEIGHAIGLLGHSPRPNDVMYCSMPAADTKVKLSNRDVNTVRKLYEQGTATISGTMSPIHMSGLAHAL